MKTDRALTFVEIDIPYCTLRYGEGACTAALGTDSDIKCFNTFATCAKRSVFNEGTVTLRFAVDASYLIESGIEAIPAITNVTYDPVKISLGEKSLGARAKLSVTLGDFPHNDTGTGFDRYRSERDYDPAKQGTFWGKFRARHPILNGRPIRLIRGVVGQSLAEMETHHLFIDGLDTAADGSVTIVGKDVLKLADGDRALAPRPSSGYLLADIASNATTATLAPSGIGNAEYPTSGHLALGGKEIVAFTRSGDTLTLTRAQFETAAVAHKAQDRAQICLYFEAEDVADILATLFVDYAGMPSEQIPLADWKDETATYLRRVYTAMIAEPTPVRELAAELVEQAALALIPDDVAQNVRLQVLRTIPTDAGVWSEENIGQGSFSVKDQPNKRITNCVTYFGLINPLEDVDDPKNYRSIEAFDATDFDIENQPRIKRIYSRWIPAFGRTIASRVNAIQIGRYNQAPRLFTFEAFRTMQSELGRGYRLEYWPLQLPTGERESVPIQVLSVRSGDAWYSAEAEEARFIELEEVDLTNRVILIDSSDYNLNLRSIHDTLFPALTEGDSVTFIVNSGVIIGSRSTGSPAVNVGSWPPGFVPTLRLRGRIQGKAGDGGRGGGHNPPTSAGSGGAGGTALYARSPITLELESGQVWGGGGGGGGGQAARVVYYGAGGGGGGGAGTEPGLGAARGSGSGGGNGGNGSATAGGAGGAASASGGRGGNGGGPGLPGSAGGSISSGGIGSRGAGGAAGRSIDGLTYITKTGSGDIRGPQVN